MACRFQVTTTACSRYARLTDDTCMLDSRKPAMAEDDVPGTPSKAAAATAERGASSDANAHGSDVDIIDDACRITGTGEEQVSKLIHNARDNVQSEQLNRMECCSLEQQTESDAQASHERCDNNVLNSTTNIVSLLLNELVINAVDNARADTNSCVRQQPLPEHSHFPRPPELPMSFDEREEGDVLSRAVCDDALCENVLSGKTEYTSEKRMQLPSVTTAATATTHGKEMSHHTGCASCRKVFCALVRQRSETTASDNISTATRKLLEQYTAKGPFNNLTFTPPYSTCHRNRTSCLRDNVIAQAIDKSLCATEFSLPHPTDYTRGDGESVQNGVLHLKNAISDEQFQECTQQVSPSTQFDWSRSRACLIQSRFQKWAIDVYTSQQARERKEKELALAKAEAAKSVSTVSITELESESELQSAPEIVDPVLWAAQEEALAAATLRDLRMQFSKNKKFNSRSVAEGSSLWSFLTPKSAKLTPEAAAEMARARIAAAAASAAMRESKPAEEEHCAEEEHFDAGDVRGSLFPRVADDSLSAQYDTVPFSAKMIPLIRAPMKKQSQAVEKTQQSEPLSTTLRLSTASKKKKVEFAAGTVFTRKRYR